MNLRRHVGTRPLPRARWRPVTVHKDIASAEKRTRRGLARQRLWTRRSFAAMTIGLIIAADFLITPRTTALMVAGDAAFAIVFALIFVALSRTGDMNAATRLIESHLGRRSQRRGSATATK